MENVLLMMVVQEAAEAGLDVEKLLGCIERAIREQENAKAEGRIQVRMRQIKESVPPRLF